MSPSKEKPSVSLVQLKAFQTDLAFRAQVISGMMLMFAFLNGEEDPEHVQSWLKTSSNMLDRYIKMVDAIEKKVQSGNKH